MANATEGSLALSEIQEIPEEENILLNLPAPGRRQPVYVIFRFSTDLCF